MTSRTATPAKTQATKPLRRRYARAQTIDLPIAADGTTPRVLIIGRGTLTGTMLPDKDGVMQPTRRLQALRLRESTMQRVRSLVAGPTYLAVEWLLHDAMDRLEQTEEVRAVRVEDLED